MSIPLSISPRVIPSIASLYNDTNRIFMEYIDNSIDSAEEFFDSKKLSYTKNIIVTLILRSDSVVIRDNCFGITNFTKVVRSVGNSDKKAQPWTNGQFGYGIYSFMAACNELKIISKLQEEKNAQTITIRRQQFDTDDQKDVNFADPEKINYTCASGTEVVLSEFDKDMWKQIDFEEIKNEIEKHFERLLSRENLKIKIINQDNKEYICQPFNYDRYEGDVYSDKLDELHYMKGRKKPMEIALTISRPIFIFLKITKGKTINKPPVFITKGRRIAEVKDIKQFQSKHKSDIWGHPNMTGYIDLSDYLEPTIARNDFKNNDKSKALFNTIKELEPLILEFIRDVNKETEAQHYQALEDKLNRALSKLAKIDAMNFRTEYLSGRDINLQGGEFSGQSFAKGFGKKDRGEAGNGMGSDGWGGENEGEGSGPSGKPGDDTPGGKNKGDFSSNKESENPFEDTGIKGGEKKKSGFNIKFVDGEIIDEDVDKPIRSHLIGGTIRIFREHPDFIRRVDCSSRTGEPRISQRLITYLAGEITVHYKDKLQTRYGQPEYNKKLFENLVEFIYQFEDIIKDLTGKNLSDFNE